MPVGLCNALQFVQCASNYSVPDGPPSGWSAQPLLCILMSPCSALHLMNTTAFSEWQLTRLVRLGWSSNQQSVLSSTDKGKSATLGILSLEKGYATRSIEDWIGEVLEHTDLSSNSSAIPWCGKIWPLVCPGISSVDKPLHKLTERETDFQWTGTIFDELHRLWISPVFTIHTSSKHS